MQLSIWLLQRVWLTWATAFISPSLFCTSCPYWRDHRKRLEWQTWEQVGVLRPHILVYSTGQQEGSKIQCTMNWTWLTGKSAINSKRKPVEFGPAYVLSGVAVLACKDMFSFVSFENPHEYQDNQHDCEYSPSSSPMLAWNSSTSSFSASPKIFCHDDRHLTLVEEQPRSLFFAKQVGGLCCPDYKTRWLWWLRRLITKQNDYDE